MHKCVHVSGHSRVTASIWKVWKDEFSRWLHYSSNSRIRPGFWISSFVIFVVSETRPQYRRPSLQNHQMRQKKLIGFENRWAQRRRVCPLMKMCATWTLLQVAMLWQRTTSLPSGLDVEWVLINADDKRPLSELNLFVQNSTTKPALCAKKLIATFGDVAYRFQSAFYQIVVFYEYFWIWQHSTSQNSQEHFEKITIPMLICGLRKSVLYFKSMWQLRMLNIKSRNSVCQHWNVVHMQVVHLFISTLYTHLWQSIF